MKSATRRRTPVATILWAGLMLVSVSASVSASPGHVMGSRSGEAFLAVLEGSEGETGTSLLETTDGGFVLTGSTSSWGAGLDDILLEKTDSAGNPVWAQAIGGADLDRGNCIDATTDGGYVVTGFSASFGAGAEDVIVIKVDSSGTLQWARTVGGAGDDRGMKVRGTPDGGCVVAGTTESFSPEMRMFLLKLDSDGGLTWARTATDGALLTGMGLTTTTDGGYVVFGNSFAYATGILVKFDPSGLITWARSIAAAVPSSGSVEETSDGGFIVCGSNWGVAGGMDLFISRHDSLGASLWVRSAGGASHDYGWGGATETPDGGFVASGSTPSFPPSDINAWLLKFDGAGNFSWARTTTTGIQSEEYYSVITTSDGGIAALGWTNSLAPNWEALMLRTGPDGNIPACPNIATVSPIIGSVPDSAPLVGLTLDSPAVTVNTVSPDIAAANPITQMLCYVPPPPIPATGPVGLGIAIVLLSALLALVRVRR